ncbi:MAG TPA: hypothetical protein VND70_01705 [Acidimicrobiales bacterium]|nr:hypothetical protein [Acidimicrobiales bacterium]
MIGQPESEESKSLEEVFLAHEFGQAPSTDGSADLDDGGAPAAPLTPSQVRRNRAAGAASGLAALLVVALGLVGNQGQPKPPGFISAQPPVTGATAKASGAAATSPVGAAAGNGSRTGSATAIRFSRTASGSTLALVGGATTATLVSTTGTAGTGNPVVAAGPGSPAADATAPAQPTAPSGGGGTATPLDALLKQTVASVGKKLPPVAPLTTLLGRVA